MAQPSPQRPVSADVSAQFSREPSFLVELGVASSKSSGAGAHDLILRGLPFGSWERLRSWIDVQPQELNAALGISERTSARRKKERRFRQDESDRLYRLGRLYCLAAFVLESKQSASRWFKTPNRALGGKTPLHLARTEPGARDVEELLNRIRYGIFS